MGVYDDGAYPLGRISDGSLISGVANFVRDTKPTVRTDGSALVVGDRWYKSDEGTEWFWNGTYWLSQQIYPQIIQGRGTITTGTRYGGETLPIPGTQDILLFIESVFYRLTINGTVNESNYFTLTGRYRTLTAAEGGVGIDAFSVICNQQNNSGIVSLNVALTSSADFLNPALANFAVVLAAVGSPTTPQALGVDYQVRRICS